MKKLAFELSAAGRVDLLHTWNHLAQERSLAVADKILADIDREIRKIAKSPGIGHCRPDLTDRDMLFFRVHSYLILYRPHTKPLNVLRVLHAARDIKTLLAES